MIFVALRDTIMALKLIAPDDMSHYLAKQVKAKRLSLNFTQKSLSERAGVSFSVVKKFEQTGKISLISLLKIAVPLGSLDQFGSLFNTSSAEQITSLDQLLNQHERKRARN